MILFAIGSVFEVTRFCLTGFLVVAAAFDLHRHAASTGLGWAVVYQSLYPLVWQLVGSAALGFVIGVLLAAWASKVTEHGEMLILLVGAILLAVGLLLTINRRFPELAPVVTTVVLAAVTVFELVGPVGARHALIRAGEARPQPPVTGLLD